MSGSFQPSPPELRATVSDAGLVMTPWTPYLLRSGSPCTSAVSPKALAGIFDLTIERTTADDIPIATDVLASELFAAQVMAEAVTDALVAWATGLGYQRVWLGHEVIALEPRLLGGVWQVRCGHCGAEWSDSSSGFWLRARAAGYFPLTCPLCAHPLAQPALADAASERATACSVTETPEVSATKERC